MENNINFNDSQSKLGFGSSGENTPLRHNRSPLKHSSSSSSVPVEPYSKPPYSKFKPCTTFDPNSVPVLPTSKTRQTEGIGRVSRRPSLLLNKQHTSKLKYSIHSWSSHSSCFYPENILVDNPNDQSSRWSTGNNNLTQFIMLELEQVSVVQTITFGKYNKVHVCNLKEFKVYGGLTPNDMVELLHNGLRNNHHPETFSLKYSFKNVLFPCKYIKIVPLLAWGANFNYSIWYVELQGNCDPITTEQVYKQYAEYRENEVIRLCLKYFRQRNFTDAFQALSNHTGLELECPMLSQLNRLVVEEGKFDEAEELICLAGERNYFDDWIASCDSTPSWRRIMATDATGHSPCMRGGHQMCIDSKDGIIYLMGGWDGYRDLGDFWKFNIAAQTWFKISCDTSEQNGPGPRSCHKICIDPVKKRIYVLGKYVDTEARANIHLDSDFYYYDILDDRWVKLSNDVSSQGGPDLIFDHQMTFDSDQQVLYVFGGKAIRPEPNTHVYSGLYSYTLATDSWKCLRSDDCSDDDSSFLKGRIGHSMMLDTIERKLYIIAGQRNKDYLSDFYVYDLDTDQVTERQRDYSILGGPDAGFTQRANIDSESRQFYVFSGLMKERTGTRDTVKNVFWSFNLDTDVWTKVYENNNVDPQYWSRMSELEPCPRFAHQMVLDTVNKVHYLFGGNPGETGNTHLRLDDFWELKLIRYSFLYTIYELAYSTHGFRPSLKEVIRKARLLIRKHKFLELCCCTNPLSSDPLEYLRTEVSELVDHSDEEESKEFRCLASHLFSNRDQLSSDSDEDFQIIWDKFKCLYESSTNSTSVQPLFNTSFTNFHSVDLQSNQAKFFQPRMVLYDKLLEIFPDNMKQPSLNLIDLVNVS